jgi:hypothetical protein
MGVRRRWSIDIIETLPAIDIAIGVDERDFLSRMADIADRSGQFLVERHFDSMGVGKLDIVNLRYQGKCAHLEGGCQLIARHDRPERITVEMRAFRWDPHPPTRDVYVTFAQTCLRPLIRQYNRQFSARYRMLVGHRTRAFRMSQRTKTLFEQFVILANTRSLHPLDWKRFYVLVREERQVLPEHELRVFLMERGFSKEKAYDLAELYGHLWAFKQSK